MVEIFALYLVCKNIRRIVQPKGLRASRYQLIAVVLWVLFEIGAMVLAAVVFGATGMGLYVPAVLGAFASLPVSFGIARNAPPRAAVPPAHGASAILAERGSG